MQQNLLLAIHEQEKIAWMKKMAAIEARKEREAKKAKEMKEKVRERVKDRQESVLSFRKNTLLQRQQRLFSCLKRWQRLTPGSMLGSFVKTF